MREKRIKGTVISGPMNVRFVTADDELPPDGTPVEIVYRDEVEIRPGQRWRLKEPGGHFDCDVQSDEINSSWAISYQGVIQACPGWVRKAQLQSWLNEHATLAEGKS